VFPSIVVAARFCGPQRSGNGGYSAGLFAEALRQGSPPLAEPPGTALEVTLRKPPPLDRPLRVAGFVSGRARLYDGDLLVADALIDRFDVVPPPPPTFAEAEVLAQHYVALHEHSFPHCFVCGTARAPGDGLRIFAGRLDEAGPVAAPFVPDASVARPSGDVPPEIIWAALDCPGYFGVRAPGTPNALLGRMAARLEGTLRVGERCVVMGWGLGQEGRKLYAGTALFGEDRRLVGLSRQVWITI
jgi:hypothetical protein